MLSKIGCLYDFLTTNMHLTVNRYIIFIPGRNPLVTLENLGHCDSLFTTFQFSMRSSLSKVYPDIAILNRMN